jgi:hypothetical protein
VHRSRHGAADECLPARGRHVDGARPRGGAR